MARGGAGGCPARPRPPAPRRRSRPRHRRRGLRVAWEKDSGQGKGSGAGVEDGRGSRLHFATGGAGGGERAECASRASGPLPGASPDGSTPGGSDSMPKNPSHSAGTPALAEKEQKLRPPAWAARAAGAPLAAFAIERRQPGPHDVLIDILYCGVCHTDIHMVRNEWGRGVFPMVPGHEIVGTVTKVGEAVTRWKTGDTVGVGCFVDSCRECESCRAGEEQHCANGMSATYNSYERNGVKLDTSRPTYGGYSTRITVNEDYVVRILDGMPLDRAAPLLCAGITTYSPLRHFGVE